MYLYAQEFPTFPNGLIYSDSLINIMKHDFDSLNIQFDKNHFNIDGTIEPVPSGREKYYSHIQAHGAYVEFESKESDFSQLRKDLDAQKSYDEITAKYVNYIGQTDAMLLIVKTTSLDTNQKEIEVLNSVGGRSESYYELAVNNHVAGWEFKSKNKWVYEFSHKDFSEWYFINAYYLYEDFNRVTIPQKYYSEMNYARVLLGEEGYDHANKNDTLGYQPITGSCSHDLYPRRHAVEEASKAGLANRPHTFLLAHLDVMNDYMDRKSDFTYEKSKRYTYLKELEAVNIRVEDLLIGLTIVDDSLPEFYSASPPRVGFAYSVEEHSDFENKIIAGMKDKSLDEFNRLRFLFIWESYIYYLKDQIPAKQKIQKLNESEDGLTPIMKRYLREFKLQKG